MTAYYVPTYSVNGGLTVVVKANANAVRIVFWDYTASISGFSSGGGGTYTEYAPATVSGGTALTPIAYRDGAPPATATVKVGATTTGTVVTPRGYGWGVDPKSNNPGGGNPGFSFTIAPGNAFEGIPLAGYTINSTTLTFIFEELRLQLSS